MDIRKKIKEVRKEKGINQQEMAQKLNISISSYQKIEQNIMVLSLERFLKICEILKIDSYNKLLPAVNNEALNEIERILLKGSLAFNGIRNNSKYSRQLLKELIDKINIESIKKDELIEELELMDSYFSIIGKYSSNQEYELSTIRKFLDKID